MAKFLTTSAVAHHVEEIVRRAKTRVVLVSPYLYWPRQLYERVQEADRRGVQTLFVYGKRNLDSVEWSKLNDLYNLVLYRCPYLHAKCYFNEEEMVISSMNLIQYSEKNNREMGILLGKADQAYRDAAEEVQSIINASELERGEPVVLGVAQDKFRRPGEEPDEPGFCIRCGASVAYDREMPHCWECYYIWNNWRNPDYQEQFCHDCGEPALTTRRKPLCDECFLRSNALP